MAWQFITRIHMGNEKRPFFEKVEIWGPEDRIKGENSYLEVTNSGEVLAFGTKVHEARWPGGYDHGFPWLHLRARSFDQGRSWDMEEWKYWEPETRQQVASVLDRSTGEIFLFSQGTWPLNNDEGKPVSESWMIANYERGKELGAKMVMEKSSDDGRSWEKVDITDQFFTYPGAGLAWFIGGGIQLQKGPHAGRLIVPARYFAKELKDVDPEKHNILYHHEALGPVYDDGYGQIAQTLDEEARNAVAYSDDHGETWHWGGSSQGYVGEACISELSDGSVYMNNRNHDPRTMGHRSWCISRDGGETFTEFGVDETLIESRCHASVKRYTGPGGSDTGPILFSNPAVFEGKEQLHPRGCGKKCRIDQTVRASYDDCKTWAFSRIINEEGGYSSLVVLEDGTILCSFARYVCRFNLAWLEAGK